MQLDKILSNLFKELYSHRMDVEAFFGEFKLQTSITFDEDYCIKKLYEGIFESDSNTLDDFVTMGFMYGYTNRSIPVLCKLLITDNHHNHEDIAMYFARIKDPSTIDSLFIAAETHFDYLDYDDTYQLARKCIKALAKIATEDALKKLQSLSTNHNEIIAGYAKKELQKINHS